jgi:hypothetical protein
LSRSIRTFHPFLSFRGTRCQDDRDGPDGGSPAWPFGAVLLLEVRAAGALVAAKPPPSHVFERVVLTAAEDEKEKGRSKRAGKKKKSPSLRKKSGGRRPASRFGLPSWLES